MSHQAATRAATSTPNGLMECPLASLGSSVLDSLSGHHQPAYHHPLSSSPLDPQIYQMSCNSPNPSIEADDIIYTPSNGMTASQLTNGNEENSLTECSDKPPPAVPQRNRTHLSDLYHLARSSSNSSLEHAIPLQRKAATFELRGRHSQQQQQQVFNAASVGRGVSRHQQQQQQQQETSLSSNTPHQQQMLALEYLLQCGRRETTAASTYMRQNGGNNADTEDSSDAAGGISNSRAAARILSRHQGGRCSVPTVGGSAAAAAAAAAGRNVQLERKMNALYLGSAMRGLPLGSEASNFQNEQRYFLENSLRNHNYNAGSDSLVSEVLPNVHQCAPSSPSETSGSDRYLHNRSSSNHLDNFSSSSNNNTSCSNLALDQQHQQRQRFHHATKVKSLSEGLSHLGRFSPSLDQGYATLVSPSPTAGHHANNQITTQGIVHHCNANSNVNAIATAVTTVNSRRHQEMAAPLPWQKKKGPLRSGPYFDRLPDEAVIKIFSWLDSCELCTVARICRRFEQLAWRPTLWKVISLKGDYLNGDKILRMIFRQLCGQSHNGSCPEVLRVMLSEGCRISDKGLQLLTRRCPELTHLQLQSCNEITQQAMVEVLTKCTNLQHLDVTGNYSCIFLYAKYFLMLKYSKGCTDIGTISPNPNLEPPRRLLLQYLDLTDCIAIDDIGLKIVVKNCPQLVFLYLRRCVQITGKHIYHIK